MTVILPQFHHCDYEICEWLNFGTFFKFPCIVRIYAWFFMHCRNYHSDSHANHVIMCLSIMHNNIFVAYQLVNPKKYLKFLIIDQFWTNGLFSIIRLLIHINTPGFHNCLNDECHCGIGNGIGLFFFLLITSTSTSTSKLFIWHNHKVHGAKENNARGK